MNGANMVLTHIWKILIKKGFAYPCLISYSFTITIFMVNTFVTIVIDAKSCRLKIGTACRLSLVLYGTDTDMPKIDHISRCFI
jgi:hypothetical protein